jgi:hypothetical protein
MSYDFHLFRPEPGVDPLVTAHQPSKGEYPAGRDPDKEARNRAVVASLLRLNPSLQVSEADADLLAQMYRVTRAEAEQYFPDIEINTQEDGSCIQISLYADEAGISIPYWYSGKKAEAVFAEVWQYLQVIENWTGFKTWDSQTDRIVETWADLKAAFASNFETVRRVQQIAKSNEQHRR